MYGTEPQSNEFLFFKKIVMPIYGQNAHVICHPYITDILYYSTNIRVMPIYGQRTRYLPSITDIQQYP